MALSDWHAGHTIIKDNPKVPVGCRTHRHVSRELITKHDHLIHQHISHHALTISHHNMPCKNKLDVLYFVVASFTWLLRASSKNRSYLRIKTTTVIYQVCCFNLQQGPAAFKFDSTKVGETDTRQPPLCKTSCMSVSGTGLMNVVM